MTRLRLSAQRARMVPAALVAAALMIAPGAAQAQDRSGGGFLDNLFNRDREIVALFFVARRHSSDGFLTFISQSGVRALRRKLAQLSGVGRC